MKVHRRELLHLGLVGGAGALVLGSLPARGAKPEGDAAVLELVADALFMSDEPGLPPAAEIDAGLHTERFLSHLPAMARLQLRGVLRGLDLAALAATGQTFATLELDARHGLLVALAESRTAPPRLAVQALKQVCAMGYFRHPRTWAAIGYDGPTLPPGSGAP